MTGPRILVLCDSVDRVGGTESYLSRVLPALAARGADVRVVARRIVDPGAFGLPATEIRWGADDEAPDAGAAREVRDAIERVRPDVVVTSNVHDARVMAAARTAPKLVVRVHDNRLFCPQGDRQYPHFPAPCTLAMATTTCLANALVRGCVAGPNARTLRMLRSRQALQREVLLADRLIVSSHFVAGICSTNGVPSARLALVPPPFAGSIAASARPARDRVLFAGRLERDKGLASLIRALSRIEPERRPELVVAGAPTSQSRALPALAMRLGVDAAFLGKLSTPELTRAIDGSTLVAVPSLWPEPFGLMGIESFARGRPVVAYGVGGIPEWMGAAGLLVRRGDERTFARAIEIALRPERWDAFSRAALAQAAAYRVDDHAAAFLAVIASIGA